MVTTIDTDENSVNYTFTLHIKKNVCSKNIVDKIYYMLHSENKKNENEIKCQRTFVLTICIIN